LLEAHRLVGLVQDATLQMADKDKQQSKTNHGEVAKPFSA
jgi:hypothetical protein